MRIKTHVKIKPFVLLRLIGIAMFLIVLMRVDFVKVLDVVKKASPEFFLLAIVFQILLLLIKSIRWHIMNYGKANSNVRIRNMGRFFESYALGVITPGRLGEVVKAGHEVGLENKINSALKVVAERGFDVAIFVLIATAAFYYMNLAHVDNWLLILFIAVGLLLLISSYLILSSVTFLQFVQRVINKLSVRLESINLNKKPISHVRVSLILILSILSNFSYFISCWFLSKSVHLDLDFITISGGVAISGLLNMLPITVAGLGTREVTFLTVFRATAESSVLAFSFMMLIVAQIGGGLIAMVLGQLFLLIDKHNSKKLKNYE
ncbi:MAG: flippase-like domain-containing protein [Bacteroidetes bacterium]|nr:flippase-like domain-containing protein [Bacteroidota bacterium]